jgi:hypothetical protein
MRARPEALIDLVISSAICMHSNWYRKITCGLCAGDDKSWAAISLSIPDFPHDDTTLAVLTGTVQVYDTKERSSKTLSTDHGGL